MVIDDIMRFDSGVEMSGVIDIRHKRFDSGVEMNGYK